MNAPIDALDRSKIFVSHSSLDKQTIWPIVDSLTAYAAIPWVDSLEMRPGDQLFRRISTAIEGTAYLLVVVSPNSVGSTWVEEEVRQAVTAELCDGKIRVIPCILGKIDMPLFLRDRLFCDFSRGPVSGTVEVLRGIHRDRHVVTLRLDKRNPLRLDEADAKHEISRILSLTHGLQKFFFVLDMSDLMDELKSDWTSAPIKGDALDSKASGYLRTRAALPFVPPNLSCALTKVADVTCEISGRTAGLVDYLLAVLQRTTMLAMYRFWKDAIGVSKPGLTNRLPSIDGAGLDAQLSAIDGIPDPSHFPTRGLQSFVFDSSIIDLLDLGFQGIPPVHDFQIYVPKDSIPEDTRSEYLGKINLRPDSEIYSTNWLRYFVPAISARHVLECAYSGQYLSHFLDRVGLRKSDYQHFGYS